MSRRVLLIVGALSVAILLASPFIYYKLKFDHRNETNRAQWYRISEGNYHAVVVSNSLDYPTGGENEIRVRNGQLINGINFNCETYALVDYLPLMIEALFDRIYNECIQETLLPTCNIVYEDTLGYPSRIDTYRFYEDGVHAPSIPITQVHIIE